MTASVLTPLFATLQLTLGGLAFLLGFIILRENPGHRLNRVVALMLFFGGFGAVLGGLGAAGRAGAGAGALQSASVVWEFFFPTVFLFASLFPEERAFTRRRLLPGRFAPGFGTLVYAPHVFHFFVLVLVAAVPVDQPLPRTGLLHAAAPLLTVGGLLVRLFLLVHRSLFSLVDLAFAVGAMVLLHDGWRKARAPRLRRQLGVVAVGLGASIVCYSAATIVPTLFGLALDQGLRSALTVAALTLGPGSIAYCVVRYKFLDARLLARRAILYALVSAALAGLYLLVRRQLQQWTGHVAGIDPQVLDTVFLVMALALFQPLIARLEAMLDAMMLEDPSDYRHVLRQLGRDLQTTLDLELVLSRTIRTLAEAMLLRAAHIVALSPSAPVVQTGAGGLLSAEQQVRLARLLPRLTGRERNWRLDGPVPGLDESDRAFLARELQLELVVPLRWRDEAVGAVLLGHKVAGTAYTSEDVALLTTLAEQVAVSLQNALLLRDRVTVVRLEEELNLARQIQRTSLLSVFPDIPRCEVHAVYTPSKAVGGDFYDVVETADGGWLVAIADVSGKGVPAALLSAMLQASLRTLAGSERSVAGVLAAINALLFRSTATHQFATFFLARVDPQSGRLRYSNAGHNWPVVFRGDGRRESLERGGMPLGILAHSAWEEGEVTLHPGDRVVLYTDGISEATDREGEQFGEERLCASVAALPTSLTARELAERTLTALHAFLGDREPQDDITLLVLRVLEPAAERPQPVREPEVVAAR